MANSNWSPSSCVGPAVDAFAEVAAGGEQAAAAPPLLVGIEAEAVGIMLLPFAMAADIMVDAELLG